MKLLVLGLLAFAVLPAARTQQTRQGRQTFTGTITDSECAAADHSQMRMGPTDAECVAACISDHGASYMLYDGKDAYTLSDQKTPQKFAAQKVTVTGTLDTKTKTIRVESIAAAKSARVQ
jgi:hypothetical protein